MSDKESLPAINDKQLQFCKEYLVDFNATKAAIRAGYSDKSAYSQAHDLLNKPEIQANIRAIVKSFTGPEDMIRKIICELQTIAFGDMRDIAEWDGDTSVLKASKVLGEKAKLISELNTSTRHDKEGRTTNIKVKLHDKMKALEMLGRYLNIFNDKKDAAPTVTISINLGEAKKIIQQDHFSAIEVEYKEVDGDPRAEDPLFSAGDKGP